MSKPPFDPNQPFEEMSLSIEGSGKKPAFDPNRPFEEVKVTPTSKLQKIAQTTEDLARGVTQGASFGFSDEILAKIENYRKNNQIDEELKRMGIDPNKLNEKALGERARQEKAILDKNRQEEAAAQERSPWAYNIGQVGGAVGTGVLTGGVGAGGSLARQMGVTALEGGITGYGASEAETLREAVPEIATGTLIGGALPIVAPIVTKAAPKIVRNIFKEATESTKGSGPVSELSKRYKLGQETKKFPGEAFNRQILETDVEPAVKDVVDLLGGVKKEGIEASTKLAKQVDDRVAAETADLAKQQKEFGAKIDQAKKELAQRETLFESSKTAKKSNVARSTNAVSEELADNLALLKDSLNSSKKIIKETLEQSDVRIGTLPLKQRIADLFGDITQDEAGKIKITKLRNIDASEAQQVINFIEDIRPYQGEIPYSKIEELKDIVQDYAFNSSLSKTTKSAFKKVYDDINISVDTSLRAKELGETADSLQNINKQYTRLFELSDYGIQPLGKRDIISDTKIPSHIAKLAEEYKLATGPTKEKIGQLINELIESPTTSLRDKQAITQTLQKGERLSKEALDLEAAKFQETLPEMIPPPKTVDKALIEKELRSTPEMQNIQGKLDIVRDVEPSIGKLLTAGTKEVQIDPRLLSTIQSAGADSNLLSNPKKIENLKEAIRKLASPEQADTMIANLDKAVERLGIITRAGRGAPTGGVASQIVGGIKEGVYKGAQVLGASKAIIRDAIKTAAPEELKKAATVVRKSMSSTYGASKKAGSATREAFAQMLDKAADNPDKIARSATVFMLLQDPKYREIMDEENKE